MKKFDVIIVGGSYAGLAAGMGLGRALRNVLIVDSAMPANRFTPRSHNFLTQDGRTPEEIKQVAMSQVDQYKTVKRVDGVVVRAGKFGDQFCVTLADGTMHQTSKLILATGIVDVLPGIRGFAECWGKSVLHCPYCHGYEVRNVKTGILGNGNYAFESGALISNWTSDLTIYTNGPSTITGEQAARLTSHGIRIVQREIKLLEHANGYVENILFNNGERDSIVALYSRPAFKQHSDISTYLGCEINGDGYIAIDSEHRTTVPGVYACGDNVTRLRTVANAVAMGTATAIALNKEMSLENFSRETYLTKIRD